MYRRLYGTRLGATLRNGGGGGGAKLVLSRQGQGAITARSKLQPASGAGDLYSNGVCRPV